MTNDIFAENAWYFRNSLVRANYNDLNNGIYETTEFLELFLRNLLLDEHNPLFNRTMHISGTFSKLTKPDIGEKKPDIEDLFTHKTADHILKIRKEFAGKTIFGRKEVMRVLDMKASGASEILKKMLEHRIIEPVSGFGKGKYRFTQQ